MRNFSANVRPVLSPAHFRRTVLIAIAVGSWLTVTNLWGQLAAGGFTASFVAKVVVNYLTPFLVANAGLLAHTEEE